MSHWLPEPWQNSVAERWIGSCRRELLEHVVVLGERHLVRLMRSYISYYHEDRWESRRAAASRWTPSPLRVARGSMKTEPVVNDGSRQANIGFFSAR